nr:hypothetical protein [Rhizobium setariae]
MLFRNGNLTVAGIVLSFSLGFLNQWASNPVPWNFGDLPTLILLASGIVTQIASIGIMLRHDSVKKRNFERGNKLFLTGIALTATGVILAVVIDFFVMVG